MPARCSACMKKPSRDTEMRTVRPGDCAAGGRGRCRSALGGRADRSAAGVSERPGGRRVGSRLACALLVAAFGVAAAGAQTTGPPKLVLGSLAIEPAFAMHTGPNSNINKDEPALAISAYETALIPHLDVAWKHGRQEVTGFTAFEFVRFDDPRTLAGTRAYTASGHNTFTEAVWTASARAKPMLGYRYRNNGARANDIEEVAQKSRRVEKTISSSLDLRVGARTHLVGEYAFQQTRYDADAVYRDNLLTDQLDYDRRVVSAGVAYEPTPLARFGTSVVRVDDRFRRNPARNNDSLLLLGTATFSPLALVSGVASAGVKSFSPPDPGAKRFTGAVVRTALSYVGGDATLAMLGFTRDTEYSYDTGKSYYVSTELRASVQQRIVGRLEGFLQGGIWTLDYQGILGGRERQVSYGGGVRFRLRPWVQTGFNLDHIRREGGAPWTATRLVGFLTYGTRFRKLERTMPGEDYTK